MLPCPLTLKALSHFPFLQISEPRLYTGLASLFDSKTFPHSAFNLWFHFSQTAGTLEIRSYYRETDLTAEKKDITLGCNKEELNVEYLLSKLGQWDAKTFALIYTDRKHQEQNVNIVSMAPKVHTSNHYIISQHKQKSMMVENRPFAFIKKDYRWFLEQFQ